MLGFLGVYRFLLLYMVGYFSRLSEIKVEIRRENMIRGLVFACFMIGLVGCTSPEKRVAEAEADVAEEKVKIIKRYGDCLEKYEGEEDVSEKCAHYKEATEALIRK